MQRSMGCSGTAARLRLRRTARLPSLPPPCSQQSSYAACLRPVSARPTTESLLPPPRSYTTPGLLILTCRRHGRRVNTEQRKGAGTTRPCACFGGAHLAPAAGISKQVEVVSKARGLQRAHTIGGHACGRCRAKVLLSAIPAVTPAAHADGIDCCCGRLQP